MLTVAGLQLSSSRLTILNRLWFASEPCLAVQLGATEQMLPMQYPANATPHQESRQIKVSEPVFVVRWRVGLSWRRLSFRVASEKPETALRKCVQSGKYQYPKHIKDQPIQIVAKPNGFPGNFDLGTIRVVQHPHRLIHVISVDKPAVGSRC